MRQTTVIEKYTCDSCQRKIPTDSVTRFVQVTVETLGRPHDPAEPITSMEQEERHFCRMRCAKVWFMSRK